MESEKDFLSDIFLLFAAAYKSVFSEITAEYLR